MQPDNHRADADALIREMRAGLEGTTDGPWTTEPETTGGRADG